MPPRKNQPKKSKAASRSKKSKRGGASRPSRSRRPSRPSRPSRHSRRPSRRPNRSRSSRKKQDGGFWLTDLIFGRKTRYDKVIPAGQARNAFLGPYRQFEQSGNDLIQQHQRQKNALARLHQEKAASNAALVKASANVNTLAANVAKFKELKLAYRQAAKTIADEYARNVGTNALAAAPAAAPAPAAALRATTATATATAAANAQKKLQALQQRNAALGAQLQQPVV
jgi:hypothetical protein